MWQILHRPLKGHVSDTKIGLSDEQTVQFKIANIKKITDYIFIQYDENRKSVDFNINQDDCYFGIENLLERIKNENNHLKRLSLISEFELRASTYNAMVGFEAWDIRYRP